MKNHISRKVYPPLRKALFSKTALIPFFLLLISPFSCPHVNASDTDSTFVDDSDDSSLSAEDIFLQALSEEAAVTLSEDIVLTEPVTISDDASIDGNGYSIFIDCEKGFIVDADGILDVCDLCLLSYDGQDSGCGVYSEGTLCFDNVTVEGFDTGIYSLGDAGFNECTVTSCQSFGLMVAGGPAELDSCCISDNNGCGIMAGSGDAQITFKDGKISYNLNSGVVINNGSFLQCGGIISSNEPWGIVQDGSYEMRDKALVGGDNYLFLKKGRTIDINGEFSKETPAKIYLSEDDRYLGREIICIEDAGDTSNDELNDCFIPCFDEVRAVKDSKEPVLEGAAIRAGNDINAPDDCMILSGLLKAVYSCGLSDDEKLAAGEIIFDDLPGDEYFYWKEDHLFSGLEQTPLVRMSLKDQDGENLYPIGGSLVFEGWNSTLSLEGEPLRESVLVPAERLSSDVTFEAAWRCCYDLGLCGNGHTNQEAGDFVIKDVSAFTLPGNDGPTLSFDDPVYASGSCGGYFKKTDPLSSFAGWSFESSAASMDAKCMKPGDDLSGNADEALSDTGRLLKILSMGAPADDEKVILLLFAIWDSFPEINAHDTYFTKDEADNDRITSDMLLSKAAAADPEDGVLCKDNDLYLVDYDPDLFKGLGEYGYATVRVAAQDSIGNTAYCDFKAYIYDSSSYGHPAFIRFISREYYNAGTTGDGSSDDASDTQDSHGGLLKDSVWYMNKEYKSIIENAFESLRKTS